MRLRALGPEDHGGQRGRPSTPTSPAIRTIPEARAEYWFLYVFQRVQQPHEGDWEMIQLVFEARDAREALDEEPGGGRLQLARGRRARGWGDDKLEIVEGTHPVVYPAAGSHANKFTERYPRKLGRSRSRLRRHSGPHVEFRRTSRRSRATRPRREAFPWIGFAGRWGELQQAFFNGPTGPESQGAVDRPIGWSEGWRDRSFAVPEGGGSGRVRPTSSAAASLGDRTR